MLCFYDVQGTRDVLKNIRLLTLQKVIFAFLRFTSDPDSIA